MKRMVIKLINIMLLALMLFTLVVEITCFAENAEYEEGRRVYDFADLFTGSEEEKLTEYALSLEIDTKTEYYILTTNDAEGKSSMEYADDFSDGGAFGYEKMYGNYIIMLIDMDNREVWISTSGYAEDNFSEARIERTLDEIFEFMPDGRYYNAAMAFLDTASHYMSVPLESNNYEKSPIEYILPSLFIAAVVSAIILLCLAKSAKTGMTVGSNTYLGNGGIRINQRDDIFTHTTTVKRKIETNNASSGSSSSNHGGGGHHTSSGGHSHGGGGRKF